MTKKGLTAKEVDLLIEKLDKEANKSNKIVEAENDKVASSFHQGRRSAFNKSAEELRIALDSKKERKVAEAFG